MAPTVDAELRRVAAELSRALLPPLFARLGAARGEFEALTRRIDEGPAGWRGDEALLAAADALGGRDRQLGWALGVLAAAVGADLLGVRREREGLRLFVSLLAEGTGVALDPGCAALPRVATTVGEGWEVPLAGAYFFLGAMEAKSAGEVLGWRTERAAGCRVFHIPDAPRLAPGATWRAILARMPGASLGEDAGHPTLAVPDPWIDE